jgi:hypothetical protein
MGFASLYPSYRNPRTALSSFGLTDDRIEVRAERPPCAGFPAFAGNDGGGLLRLLPRLRLLSCSTLPFRQQRLADAFEFAALGVVDLREMQVELLERADDG